MAANLHNSITAAEQTETTDQFLRSTEYIALLYDLTTPVCPVYSLFCILLKVETRRHFLLLSLSKCGQTLP